MRSFQRICQDNNIRVIKVHHVNRTMTSPTEDAQDPGSRCPVHHRAVRTSTTLEIPTDVDDRGRKDALTRLHQPLDDDKS